MSQTADNVAAPAKVRPTNVPYHLIVTDTPANAVAIAKHFDLNDMRMLDSIPHLPAGGMKRGEAIQAFLGKHDHTITLAVVVNSIWVKALLSHHAGMAGMVWRSIEEQVLGVRTDTQRQLLIVGTNVAQGVRKAEEKNELISLVAGVRVPSSWRPAKPAQQPKRNAPKAEKKDKGPQFVEGKDKIAVVASGKPTQPKQEKRLEFKEGVHDGGLKGFHAARKKGEQEQKQRPKRSQKVRGPRPPGNSNDVIQDLYLACKGHYGPTGGSFGVELIKEVIKFHSGAQRVSDEQAAQRLFHTLVRTSNHSYWGSYTLVQAVIKAGAQNSKALLDELIGHISLIPAKDSKGEDIAQPSFNQKLSAKLQAMELFGKAVAVPQAQEEAEDAVAA